MDALGLEIFGPRLPSPASTVRRVTEPQRRERVYFADIWLPNEDGSYTIYGSVEAREGARKERREKAARENPIDPDAPLLCEICEEPVEVFNGLDPSSVYPNDGLRHQFGEFDKHGRDLVAHRSCVFKADREAAQEKAREAAEARVLLAEADREAEPERQAWLRLRLQVHEESRSRFGRWLDRRLDPSLLKWFDETGVELRREIDPAYDELAVEWERQQAEEQAEAEAQIKQAEEHVEWSKRAHVEWLKGGSEPYAGRWKGWEPTADRIKQAEEHVELLREWEKRDRASFRRFNELNQTSRRTRQ